MPRLNVRNKQFDTTFKVEGKSIAVQDMTCTTKAVIQKLSNGVADPEALDNGATYEDFGLPANMSRLDRLDLLRETKARAELIKSNLAENPEPEPVEIEPVEPQPNEE